MDTDLTDSDTVSSITREWQIKWDERKGKVFGIGMDKKLTKKSLIETYVIIIDIL